MPSSAGRKVPAVAAILHIPTLTLCLAATLVIVSGFLTLLWSFDRTDRALARWSLGFWVGCAGLCLVSLRDVAPSLLALGLGNAASIWSLGLIWLGCVAFEGEERRGAVPLALAGGSTWLFLFAVPAFANDLAVRLLVASLFYSTYSFLIVQVLWSGQRREPLPARVVAIAAFGMHGLAYVLRIPLQFIEPVQLIEGYAPTWYGLMTFGFVAQGLMGALAVFAMVHERTSRRYKLASEIDFLTSIRNRRAFLAAVERDRTVAGGRVGGAMLALIDADHFKAINDTHGHAAGDAALVALAKLFTERLPPGALVGRLGGEEFGIYLPQGVASQQVDLLDDLRRYIGDTPISHDHGAFRLTVSIGAVWLPAERLDLSLALAAADRALYASKEAGRDRVSFESLDPAPSDPPLVSHLAERMLSKSPEPPRSAA